MTDVATLIVFVFVLGPLIIVAVAVAQILRSMFGGYDD